MATTAPANDAINAPQSIRRVIRQAGAVSQMCITFRTASLWSQQRLRERQGSFISSVMQKCHLFRLKPDRFVARGPTRVPR